MSIRYRSYKAKIKKMWQQLDWMKTIAAKESLVYASFINRRLMHRYVRSTGQQTKFNDIFIHTCNKSYMLAAVHQATGHIPPGAVVIQGAASLLTNEDWLSFELALIKEQLNSGTRFKVSDQAMRAHMNRTTGIPFTLHMYVPPWVKILAPILPNAFETNFCQELSSDWNDVFSMKTDEDAILLGIIACVMHNTKRVDPEGAMPDLLAMAPKQAGQLLLRMLTPDGSFTGEQCCELIKKLHQTSMGLDVSNVVGGFDFSAMVESSCLTSDQPLISNNTLVSVHGDM